MFHLYNQVVARKRAGGTVDEDMVLLLHCNGTDGSTSFPDSALGGNAPHTITANGDAQVDTAQKKFGTGSLLGDGTGDYLETPDNANWDFSGAFTIDFWVRFNDVSDYMALITHGGAGLAVADKRGWSLNYLKSGHPQGQGLQWRVYNDSDTLIDNFAFNWVPSTATWYHVALTVDGSNNLRVFIDGTQIGSTETNSGAITFSSYSLRIGYTHSDDNAGSLDGWIDEPEILNGRARWTANFTPETSEYSPYQ
jgi:hypothetical protein